MASEYKNTPGRVSNLKMSLNQEMLFLLTETSNLPFYALLGLYIAMFSPHIQHVEESFRAVLFKVLPIWYLAYLVYQKRNGNYTHVTSSSSSRQSSILENNVANGGSNGKVKGAVNGDYKNNMATKKYVSTKATEEFEARERVSSHQNFFLIGLYMSSLGDAALVYKHFFKVGVLFFAIAQVLYLCALRKYYIRGRLAWIAFLLHSLLYYILFNAMDENIMKVMIFIYSSFIHSMLFFAIASFESRPSALTLSTAIGASSFIISDFLIGFSMWHSPFPYANAIIMISYYIAQLLLSVGVPKT